uniref:Small EDRK-rich factor 1A n=1 Tax=Pongo abelii TaxID=9601 RepID=A0A8I5U2V9_PONAB
MARGNQRELARQKNMKKTQEISKGKRKEDSLTASQRKQRDSCSSSTTIRTFYRLGAVAHACNLSTLEGQGTLRSCNKSRRQLMRRSLCRQEKSDDWLFGKLGCYCQLGVS